MQPNPKPQTGLAIFRPPYRQFEVVEQIGSALISAPGQSVVWRYGGNIEQRNEFEVLLSRPLDLPLVVLLSPDIGDPESDALLRQLHRLRPKALMSDYGEPSAFAVRQALCRRPRDLPDACCQRLKRVFTVEDPFILEEVRRILRMAREVKAVRTAARRLYSSRRTIGRHLDKVGLPPPSRLLQVGRLLAATVDIQAEDISITRAAVRLGYPDVFTLSNQMLRLIGVRPTVVKQYLGWEWVLEAWIRREGLHDRSAAWGG